MLGSGHEHIASRRIVVHHNDIGANHGTNTAFVELCDLGICTSGSVTVPCPWFDEMAAIARDRPDLDLGVHLTLNAEFPKYRWRPLTGVADNGLTDADGFMWRDVASAWRARPEAVEAELRAQIDTALAAGIDVTHLDSHMHARLPRRDAPVARDASLEPSQKSQAPSSFCSAQMRS